MTRRDHNADATRFDILAAGREMFSQRPYSDVSGMQICDRAGVTDGVLQHHFGSKLGLFMAVLEGLQHSVSLQISEAINQEHECWQRVRAGVGAFLDACTQPAYRTVVLIEGPAAIGWKRWQELNTEYYGDLIRTLTSILDPAGLGDYASAMLGATMRGTLTELSFEIAQAADQISARQDASAVVDKLLSNFRTPSVHSSFKRPARIGIGQLRAQASTYLDRVAAGEILDVMRRGRIVARLQQPTS